MTREKWIADRFATWVDEDVSWGTLRQHAPAAAEAFAAAADALEAAKAAPWRTCAATQAHFDKLDAFGKAMGVPFGHDPILWAGEEIKRLQKKVAAKTPTLSDTATRVVTAADAWERLGTSYTTLELEDAIRAHRAACQDDAS